MVLYVFWKNLIVSSFRKKIDNKKVLRNWKGEILFRKSKTNINQIVKV